MNFGQQQIVRLQKYVRSLKRDERLAPLISHINSSGEAFVFGGAARDVAFIGPNSVNDLDIFVSGQFSEAELTKMSTYVRHTNFGGLRLALGAHDIDIWELSKSYAFRFDSPSYVSVENLLKSVCFSTDGIAVSLQSGRVLRSAAFDVTFASRRLDFVVPPDSHQAIVATRVARLALKLNLSLTPAVASYFMSCTELLGIEALIDAESRWEKRILNEITIEQVLGEIRHAIDKAYESLTLELNECEALRGQSTAAERH